MTNRWFLALGMAVVTASGCSSSDATSSPAAMASGAVAATVHSLPGAITKSPVASAQPTLPNGGTDKAIAPPAVPAAPSVNPFPEVGDLFAPPKVVIPVVTPEPEVERQPQPEAVEERKPDGKPLPQLRLVGFVEVEGLKALLSVEGKLNVVTIGDTAEGLKIIAIEPPAVTLKHGDDGKEFQMNLFDQPWFYPSDGVVPDRKIGGSPVLPRNSAAPPPPGIGATPGMRNIGKPGAPPSVPQFPAAAPPPASRP